MNIRFPVMRKRAELIFSLACVVVCIAGSQEIGSPLPGLPEQAAAQQEWLKIRLERVLPALMREHGIAMWIVSMREYNEDPVFSSLVSPTSMSARRRTIFVFNDRGAEKGVERLALGGGTQGGLYVSVRDTSFKQDGELWGAEQWTLLRKVVDERNPRNIAVNISPVHAFSDGLSAGEWEQMQLALGEEYAGRIVRAERLPLDYIAIRIPEMLPLYRQMMETAHALIAEAFSNKVITPGASKTEDVVWWFRQKMQELGFGTWFQPSVDVQRRGVDLSGTRDVVIQRGDVLHCDVGLTAMRLNTDTQHMGYVLREGEREVPPGLVQALHASNRLQDIVTECVKVGRTGNEILGGALGRMREAGIEGTVYCHPVGEHGHGAGTVIGLWDRQEGVPGRGDVPVRANTWYSIELQATSAVPEWDGQKVTSAQEEDVLVSEEGKVEWFVGRQTRFHIVE